VTNTLQIDPEPVTDFQGAPHLLVEWPPRWQEFKTSIGPAFSRSGRRLAGEAPLGIYHYRGMLAGFLLQVFLLFVFIVLPREVERLRPYAPAHLQSEQAIYYSADELPRTEDVGGAASGATGRAGGQQAHHRSQTIKVSRGSSLAQQVVDAPNLKLPPSNSAVANLLTFKAVKPIPGAPAAEGFHSEVRAPNLPANVIAPAPADLVRDRFRSGLTLTTIVPPAPEVSSSRSRTAPSLTSLSAAIVPPTPSVHSEHPLYAPRLDASIIGPAPNVSRDHNRAAPALNSTVVAPASTAVSREQSRSAPALNGAVIAPAPTTVQREVSPSRVQMNSAAIVPPPVSAPERESSRTAKMNLPSPSVVAPPPSSDARDLARMESGRLQSATPAVVPPPPTQAANGSFLGTIVGKLFGTQDVVPPPPSVASESAAGTSRNSAGGSGTSLTANVIPPPPSFGNSKSQPGGSSPGRSPGQGGANVVPPPPLATDFGSGNGSSSGRSGHPSLAAGNVVPPPPNSSGSGSGSGQNLSGRGTSGGGALPASNVVPPPPSVGSGTGASGSGRRGFGSGGPGDIGSVAAPPKTSAGAGENSAVVLSANPGSKAGLPGNGGKGSLALSPSGGDKPGIGGSGGGSSIGNGPGSGSGLTGDATGAGKTGSAHGSDSNARSGISPTPGPGGSGSAPNGIPAAPGVDVRGGSTVVNLPSFDSGNSSAPTLPERSSIKGDPGPAITIVATSRSGGAFDFYGKLPGDNYTVYVDTNLGTVVMQFADADPGSHPGAGALTGPQGIRTDLPVGLARARVVIKCKLDASGNLKSFQVLEPGPADLTAKLMASLPSWKFRPAMRGAQPVEVNAILGFNIDTNDRY
jgi:hypothetical protein